MWPLTQMTMRRSLSELTRSSMILNPAYHLLESEEVEAALHYYRERRVEILQNLIHKHLLMRLDLPAGSKMSHSDGFSVSKYEGSQRFKDLEDWLALLVIYIEHTQYNSRDRDHEHVLMTTEFIKGQALLWYMEHVILATTNDETWSFEEIIVGLYDHFAHLSAWSHGGCLNRIETSGI